MTRKESTLSGEEPLRRSRLLAAGIHDGTQYKPINDEFFHAQIDRRRANRFVDRPTVQRNCASEFEARHSVPLGWGAAAGREVWGFRPVWVRR